MTLYESQRGVLLDEYLKQKQKVDAYALTVYTTWKVSYDRLSAKAMALIQICAFLHREGVFAAMLENAAIGLAQYDHEE